MLKLLPEDLVKLLETLKQDIAKSDSDTRQKIDAIIEILKTGSTIEVTVTKKAALKKAIRIIKKIGIEIFKHEVIELIIKAIQWLLNN